MKTWNQEKPQFLPTPIFLLTAIPRKVSSFYLGAQIPGKCYKTRHQIPCLIPNQQPSNIPKYLTHVILKFWSIFFFLVKMGWSQRIYLAIPGVEINIIPKFRICSVMATTVGSSLYLFKTGNSWMKCPVDHLGTSLVRFIFFLIKWIFLAKISTCGTFKAELWRSPEC